MSKRPVPPPCRRVQLPARDWRVPGVLQGLVRAHLVRSSFVLRHALGVLAALGGGELGHPDLPVAGAHGQRGVAAVGEELGLEERGESGGGAASAAGWKNRRKVAWREGPSPAPGSAASGEQQEPARRVVPGSVQRSLLRARLPMEEQ